MRRNRINAAALRRERELREALLADQQRAHQAQLAAKDSRIAEVEGRYREAAALVDHLFDRLDAAREQTSQAVNLVDRSRRLADDLAEQNVKLVRDANAQAEQLAKLRPTLDSAVAIVADDLGNPTPLRRRLRRLASEAARFRAEAAGLKAAMVSITIPRSN